MTVEKLETLQYASLGDGYRSLFRAVAAESSVQGVLSPPLTARHTHKAVKDEEGSICAISTETSSSALPVAQVQAHGGAAVCDA